MIRLHLLGFTPDLKGLVFSGRRGGKSATYWVSVDKSFLEALEQLERAREEQTAPKGSKGRPAKARLDEAKQGAIPTDALEVGAARTLAVTDTQDLPLPSARRTESKLSPREVQQFLREGKSVKEVAKLAEVDPSWVERFVGPVLEEKAGVVRMTQDAYQSRARLGRSGLPIGEAVVSNLQERKATAETLDGLDEGWEARRTKSRTWRVRLVFQHRAKRRVAEWEFRKDTGAARPKNKLATELGWWPDERPRAGTRSTQTAAGDDESSSEGDGSGLETPSRRNSTGGRTTAKSSRGGGRSGTSARSPRRESSRRTTKRGSAGRKTKAAKRSSSKKAGTKSRTKSSSPTRPSKSPAKTKQVRRQPKATKKSSSPRSGGKRSAPKTDSRKTKSTRPRRGTGGDGSGSAGGARSDRSPRGRSARRGRPRGS